jgi:NADPH:quinone reductase-like Zn-dependent oxidoreductase
MRAVICDRYGGPEVLEIADDIPVPRAGATGVLVRVQASSVNPVDWKLREGWLSPLWKLRFPVIWGCDFSGTVEQIGPAVTLFKPGDEVYGFKHGKVGQTYRGTYAEYVVIPESTLAHKPANLNHEQAASVPLAAVTAWQALVGQGRIGPGTKVLVHAGSGGVGLFAVQIAKAFGAYVAATASTRNQDFLRQLGADQPIDYTTERIENKLFRYDLVLDAVGESVWPASLKVLRAGGKLVTLTLPIPKPPASRIKFFSSVISSVARTSLIALLRGKRLLVMQAKPRGGDLEKLNAFIEAGKLRPVIEKTYPLEQIGEAHRQSEAGHVRGKLVVKIRSAL